MGTESNHNLHLVTNLNPRLTILANGNTGIGTTNPSYKFQVAGHSYFDCYPANSGLYIENYLTTTPIIRPQFNNTAYLGNSSSNFWRIYTYYLHYNVQSYNSDRSIKENIRAIQSPLSDINNLRGVKFDYKEETYSDSPVDKMETLVADAKDNYGFIAQEMLDVFPKLVIYDETSELYGINYVGLIPILVEAMKEQQSLIEELQTEVANMKSGSNLKSASVTNPTDESIESNTLFQNSPNPFNESTKINYFISDKVQNASINVYDLTGKQLKCVKLHPNNNGSIRINGGELRPGTYLYNLIADGKLVSSKQMVLTD